MNKEKIMMVGTPILFILLFISIYLNSIIIKNDSIKFKNEYEALNKKYYSVSINKNNPIKYSTYKEIFDIIQNKSGIIYFGYPECDDCRFAIETLLKVIEDNEVKDTVYYFDIHNDRDSYTVENNELVYEKDKNNKDIKGKKEYFKLLKLLDKNLSNYILYVDGAEYDTKEKRIHFPSVVFVKNGKVLGLEYASVDIEYEDLYNIYEDYILNMYSDSCSNLTEEAC